MTLPLQPLHALEAARRRRGPECASDLGLDRLLAGELADTESARLRAHLESCAPCEAARATLAADRGRFLEEASLPTLAADTLARAAATGTSPWTWLRKLVVPAALLTSAAAAAGLWLRPVTPPVEGTRAKGVPFGLTTYVLHAEVPEQGATGSLHQGEPLHPGDRLQFRYHGERGFLAVIAVDAAARVSVYYPPGSTAVPVEAGRDLPLATAVELDETLGPETVIAVYCREPVPVARIVEAARLASGAHGNRGARGAAFGPADLGCSEARQTLTKAAPVPVPR